MRRFTENDIEALYKIFSDQEVNRFLPWFPLTTVEEAGAFYEKQFESRYNEQCSCHYAICLREDDNPIGYVDVGTGDSYDFGYGLCKEFWHRGIVTEAGRAVIEQLREDGITYITATHDVNNPRSGDVMKRLGMTYQYSYEEQWQPKDFLVIFRMYQLNLDGDKNRIYKKYWDNSAVHFLETGM